MGEGGDAAFDVDFEVEGSVGVGGLGEFDDDGAAGGAAEGVFVHVAETEAAEDDAAVGGAVARRAGWGRRGGGCARARGRRRWRRRSAGDFGEGAAHLAATGGVARDEFVVHVRHGDEGGAGGADVGDEVGSGDEPADFEAFADGEFGLSGRRRGG